MWYNIFFSPNGGTRKCAQLIQQCSSVALTELDLTRPLNRQKPITFTAADRVIISVPVYCGRIPQIPLFDQLTGHQTPALLVAVYGNRAYDDALLELKTQLSARNFHCVGALAMLAPHCFVPQEVTPDRPDAADRHRVQEFIAQLDWSKTGDLKVPGNVPYRPYPEFPFVPETLPGCSYCHRCETICPVGAIQGDITDPAKCIRCAACVNACPRHCRVINHPGFTASQNKLRKLANLRHEVEFFQL